MSDVRSLTVYLAGPVSNCNEKQKTEWRKKIKKELARFGHQTKDPSDHIKDWTPLIEMVEIDKSDVVIANLWRESIGTVVGIVQARRKGKPVILIDQNYVDSFVLEKLVGKEWIVRGVDEAVNLLQNQILRQLAEQVSVRKKDGKIEPFMFSKLHDSLSAVCARVHVEDAVLPELVAHEVYRAVIRAARNGEINTERIKRLVFEQLSEIMKDKLYEDELKQCAYKLRQGWETHEKVKKDQRWALQCIEELEAEKKLLADQVQALEVKCASLQEQLESRSSSLCQDEQWPKGTDLGQGGNRSTSIERALAGKHGLCICRLGKGSFAEVFERQGLSQVDFKRLFEERQLEGKQSNLNSTLRRDVKSYSYLLYAGDGLRHLDRKLRMESTIISGARPIDVVNKFIEVLEGKAPQRAEIAMSIRSSDS